MVILPAYNEADNLERLVKEIICLPHNDVEKYTVLKFHEC